MLRNNYNSAIEEIKNYTRDLLSDGMDHSIAEIKKYVREKTGRDFTNGEYVAALRDLVAKERSYENIRIGYYRWNNPNNNQTSNQANNENSNLAGTIKDILEDTISQIYDVVGKNNPLNMSDADLETVKEIKEILNYLETSANNF